MSGGDGRDQGNTGLGHNGGKPSGNVNGSSGNGGHTGNNGSSSQGGMRAPTAAEVAGQYNSYGGSKISASQVSNIRSDGFGGYKADIKGADNNVSLGGPGATTSTLGGFTGVSTSGNGNGNNNGGSGGKGGGTPTNPAWTPAPGHPSSYLASNNNAGLISVDDNTKSNVNTYTLHFGSSATAVVTVPSGDRSKMKIEYKNWKGPKYDDGRIEKIVGSFMNFRAEEKKRDEKEALTKASELISDMGDKIGKLLGEKYRSVAKEIANDIKNFQGKTMRTHKQAMASLNKILANPGMKINKGDKDALINAWKALNASDTANKLSNLSRAFKVADLTLKAEKIRQKSIEGYETGDWSPLMLEVESWVLSGMAAGVAMALFGSILSMLPISGLALTAITIAGILTISYLSSKIDDKVAEKINNEVIRPAK
ncbi:colicin-like pore-forming protein [Klebsiella sp. CN_Kp116]|uniref:colicin-like pore-forming protein n=1 Tax=unclassified Klebsiella TaxID=2608929 RepID=UPI0032B4A023